MKRGRRLHQTRAKIIHKKMGGGANGRRIVENFLNLLHDIKRAQPEPLREYQVQREYLIGEHTEHGIEYRIVRI